VLIFCDLSRSSQQSYDAVRGAGWGVVELVPVLGVGLTGF